MPLPLGEVKVDVFVEDEVFEKDVDMETAVKYQYLRNLFNQSIEFSRDENFKRLIVALAQSFNPDSINQLCYLAVSCLAIPKFFHKYGFLLQQFKSSNNSNLQYYPINKDYSLITTRSHKDNNSFLIVDIDIILGKELL